MAKIPKDPRYLQISEALRERIRALGPESLLPSEHTLARRFRVSRLTIRRALGLLERAGLVSRVRGRGTTVNQPKITRRFFPVYTLEEDLRDQGIKFETKVLTYERQHEPPAFVATRLQLPAGESVGFLSLARLVDDRIICHDRRYFPSDIAARFDPAFAQEGAGVSEVLVQLTGMALGTIEWECDITPCSREVAEVLRVTPGTLIAASAFTDSLESGRPIETGVISYRIDLCKFRFEGKFGDVLMWRRANRLRA